MTITEFLLARIAEDEAVAVATRDSHDPLPWTGDDCPSHLLQAANAGAWHMDGPVDGPSGYASIVIDPARVLAECEAKRRTVEEHLPDRDGDFCGCCWLDDLGSWEPHPCPTIRALALPYDKHPDYDPSWRVS